VDIEATAGSALARLAVRFRRHYFHLPYELAPDDLIAEGLVLNLDWDERDSLWVQLDPMITIDAPVGGSPLNGLTGPIEGCGKAVQPLIGEERVGPALVIATMAPATASASATQDAPKTHSHPAVQVTERTRPSVLEVHVPTPQDGVDRVDDD